MLSFQYIVSYSRHNVYLSKDVTLARYKSYEARTMLSFQYMANVTSLLR
jgi:hypothetical protein